MKLSLRLRFVAAAGMIAAVGVAGCHLIAPDRHSSRHKFEPEVLDVHEAAPVPYEDKGPPILQVPAPSPQSRAIEGGLPDFVPPSVPPALPPAAEETPVPSAGLKPPRLIRPISHIQQVGFESPCGSCVTCPTPCCKESIGSKLRRIKMRMDCMHTRLKSKLSRLNPLNCGSCNTCPSPCSSSFVTDEIILDGVVVGEYPMGSYVVGDGFCPTCPSAVSYPHTMHHHHGHSSGWQGQMHAPQFPTHAPHGAHPQHGSHPHHGQAPCNCRHQGGAHHHGMQMPQQPAYQGYNWQQQPLQQRPYPQQTRQYPQPVHQPASQYPQHFQQPQSGQFQQNIPAPQPQAIQPQAALNRSPITARPGYSQPVSVTPNGATR